MSVEKRWQFVAVVADQALIAGAVANWGYMGYGFAYAQRRDTGESRRYQVKTPLGIGAMVGHEPGEFSRLSLPTGTIDYQPKDDANSHLSIWNRQFQAEFDVKPSQPWDANWDIPGGGKHRTRKRMGGPAEGHLVWDGRAIALSGHSLLDWSAGAMGRETAWRWAAGVGRVGQEWIAWNLRTGFDDPAQYENAVWVEGKPAFPGLATIEPGDTWLLSAGELALTFTPEGVFEEDHHVGLVANRYSQPWGRFTGTWQGRPLEGYGVVEDHWIRG